MIGEEVVDARALLDTKLLVNSLAVEILRQRAGIVIDEHIKPVVDELRVLFSIADDPLHSAAERVEFVSDSVFPPRRLGQAILVVPLYRQNCEPSLFVVVLPLASKP